MDTSTTKYRLLDSLCPSWPWKRSISPHLNKETTLKTLSSLLPTPESDAMRRKLAWDSAVLAALAYPTANLGQFAVAHQLTLLIFLLDEHSERLSIDETGVFVAVAKELLYGHAVTAHRNVDAKTSLHEGILSACERFADSLQVTPAPASARKHIIDGICTFVDSFVPEAEYRTQPTGGEALELTTYMTRRTANIGADAHFAVGELVLGVELVDGDGEAGYYNPSLVRMRDIVSRMFVLSNDLVSYHKERLAGERRAKYNALSILISQGRSFEDAEEVLVGMYHALAREFLSAYEEFIATIGDDKCGARAYAEHLAYWPRAQECFNFESGRYRSKT
ncbi:Terpene cyclase [Mycena kentingensis (nom. inval.)]|nr:Terpene cyclase [Mycena kentingensis (nom. inval.)]